MENKKILEKRLAEVIRTDAKQVKIEDFLATHTPFKNLKYTNSGTEIKESQNIDENDFYQNKFKNELSNHHFMVIQGDNGTGKSHFIRWIKERFSNEIPSDEELVFISRSQNTLRGALQQIIGSNIFTDELKNEKLKKLIKANEHLSEEYLKKNIVHQFAIASQEDDGEENKLRRRYKRRVHDFLVSEIIQEKLLKIGGPIDRIKSKLSTENKNELQDEEAKFYPNDFKINRNTLMKLRKDASTNAFKLADDLSSPNRGQNLRENLAHFLNNKLDIVIQNSANLNATDLKQVFEEVRMELKKKNKNLILFIEDITSFTGIDKALVEVLVTRHSGSKYNEKFCRLFSIVGVTNGYYRNRFPSNLKDRVTDRVIIDNMQNISSKRELAKFTARYINAINLKRNDFSDWLNKYNGDEREIPVAKDKFKYGWSIINIKDNLQMSIFPFNKQALWKLFEALPHKNIRLFLNQVIKRLLQYYASNDKFPPPANELESENFELPSLKGLNDQMLRAQAEEDYKHLNTLFRVWGNETIEKYEGNEKNDIGGINPEIFDVFNIKKIDGFKRSKESSNNNIDIKTKNEKPSDKDKEKTEKNDKESKKEKDFEKMKKRLENWNKGGILKAFKDLRDYIKVFLKKFINWEFHGVPGYLVDGFFKGRRFSIEGQSTESLEGFQVKRNNQSKYALLALSAWEILGDKSWNFDGSIDHLNNLTNWALNVKEDIIEAVKSPPEIKKNDKWDMKKWNLLSEFYIQLISGNFDKNDNLNDIYFKIMTDDIEINEEKYRSAEWTKLKNKLNNKTETQKNHDLVIKDYNFIQGDILSSTNKRFLDTVKILENLKTLKNKNWEVSNLDLPDLKTSSTHIWYHGYNLLKFLDGKVQGAIESEENKLLKNVNKITEIIGNVDNDKELNELFEEMDMFLRDVLKEVGAAYDTSKFEGFLEGDLNSTDMINIITDLKKLIDEKNYNDKILAISDHPLKDLIPYIDLLKNMDELVEDKYKSYERKLKKSKSGIDLEEKRVEIYENLTQIKNDLKKL